MGYLHIPTNRACTTLQDLVAHFKSLTTIPSKLLKELDSLLMQAKHLRSMFLKGPSYISLSRKIRKLKLEFDHEISKLLYSLRASSSSIMERAIGSDPSDASSETVVK